MKTIVRIFITSAVLLGVDYSNAIADPDTELGGPLKVSYKGVYVSTYNVFFPLDHEGKKCNIYTFVETYVECEGNGNIDCVPGLSSIEESEPKFDVNCNQ